MSFEARLYIQGTGVYVPHTGGKKMLVLFPSQEQANKRGLRDIHGNPICRHHAVVQVSARCLGDLSGLPAELPDPWTTLDVSGLWVGFKADGADGNEVPPFRMAGNNGVPGIPYLPDVLRDFKMPVGPDLDQRAWPGNGGSAAELLAACLFLDAGVLSPYAEYEGLFRFNGQADQRISSVLKLELGRVDSFSLRFRAFDSSKVIDLPLDCPWNELEVWVRHFCDLSRSDPDQELPEAGEADVDFALNYALLQDLDKLLDSLKRHEIPEIPVPRVSTSWVHGGPIGLEPRKCNGVSVASQNF
jgi:hypothetical protein